MPIDEKLEELCNAIENLLKHNDKYEIINYENTCGYLSNENVTNFRKKTECFRHATNEALLERNRYNVKQKKFLIEYGILIIKYILLEQSI